MVLLSRSVEREASAGPRAYISFTSANESVLL